MLRIMQAEAPNMFKDYTFVPLPDGTLSTHTEHVKV